MVGGPLVRVEGMTDRAEVCIASNFVYLEYLQVGCGFRRCVGPPMPRDAEDFEYAKRYHWP